MTLTVIVSPTAITLFQPQTENATQTASKLTSFQEKEMNMGIQAAVLLLLDLI